MAILNSDGSLSVTRDIGLHGHLRARDNHTSCRAFNSVIVFIWFNDVGRSRSEFEQPTFRIRREDSYRVCLLLSKEINTILIYLYISYTPC